LQASLLDATGNTAVALEAALDKARRRSVANRQQQHQHLLTVASAQQQALLAAAQQGDEAAQLQLQQQQQLVPEPEVAEGDDALFGRVEGEALRIAAMSVRRDTEGLSDAEDELFVHNTGRRRDTYTA
jgi:multidrug efflux pump subunit AcrA (membrane-fusion protein)